MKQIFAYKAFVSELKGCKNKNKNKYKTRGTKLEEKNINTNGKWNNKTLYIVSLEFGQHSFTHNATSTMNTRGR